MVLLVLAILTVAGVPLMVRALDIEDRADCTKWARQADAYPGFFITESEKAQCDYYSIPVSAPVR